MNELKGYATRAPLKELYYSFAQMSAAKTISTDQVKKSKYRQIDRVHRLLFRFSRSESIVQMKTNTYCQNDQRETERVRESMPLACFVCVFQLWHTFYFLTSVYCKHEFYCLCGEPSLDKQSKRNIYAIGLTFSLVALIICFRS